MSRLHKLQHRCPTFYWRFPLVLPGISSIAENWFLYTEAWMMVVALILAVLTISGFMTPWLLLRLTFALSAGDAFETPTWRAILPEVVSKDDLAAASALNGIEFNLARAVGPRTGGLGDRSGRCRNNLCRELHVVLRGRSGRGEMEKTYS